MTVYHRDLKPENIMCKVDGDGQITSVVLGDFGLATQDPRAFAYSVGSLHFISPGEVKSAIKLFQMLTVRYRGYQSRS